MKMILKSLATCTLLIAGTLSFFGADVNHPSAVADAKHDTSLNDAIYKKFIESKDREEFKDLVANNLKTNEGLRTLLYKMKDDPKLRTKLKERVAKFLKEVPTEEELNEVDYSRLDKLYEIIEEFRKTQVK